MVKGYLKPASLVDLGVKADVVEKSGSWYSYNSERIGQGRENAKQFLKDNPDMANEIERAIRQNAGLVAEEMLTGESDSLTMTLKLRKHRKAST